MDLNCYRAQFSCGIYNFLKDKIFILVLLTQEYSVSESVMVLYNHHFLPVVCLYVCSVI